MKIAKVLAQSLREITRKYPTLKDKKKAKRILFEAISQERKSEKEIRKFAVTDGQA